MNTVTVDCDDAVARGVLVPVVVFTLVLRVTLAVLNVALSVPIVGPTMVLLDVLLLLRVLMLVALVLLRGPGPCRTYTPDIAIDVTVHTICMSQANSDVVDGGRRGKARAQPSRTKRGAAPGVTTAGRVNVTTQASELEPKSNLEGVLGSQPGLVLDSSVSENTESG